MTTPASHCSFTRLTAMAALLAGGFLMCNTNSVWAQGSAKEPPNFLAFGVALVPEFEGSSKRSAAPALIGRLAFGPTTLRLLGNTVQWNLLPESSPWSVGPVLSLRSARDDDVEDVVVQRLRPIEASAGAGIFGEYRWRGLIDPTDSLTAGVELQGGKNGARAQASLGYQRQVASGLRLDVSSHVGAASGKYQRTYFDVDADNATRSGLPTYGGDRGVDEVGLATGLSYELGRDWLLIGRLQVARLVGDAANSPIVKLGGSRNQNSLVLAVGRSF